MDVVLLGVEAVMGDFGEEGVVCDHGVVNEFEVGLLCWGEVWGKVYYGEVDVRIGKGRLGLPE